MLRTATSLRQQAPSLRAATTALVVATAVVLATGVAGALVVTGEAAATASASTAGGDDPTIDLAAGDVEIGEDEQSLDFRLGPVEPGGEVDVYVDVTRLTEANVNLDDADIAIQEVDRASVTADRIVQQDGAVVVHLTLDLEDGVDRTHVRSQVTGLNTDDAEHTTDLRHYAAVDDDERFGDDAPGPGDTESTPYDVFDPAERDPDLRVGPHDLDVGDDSQTVTVRGSDVTRDFRLGVDVRPLTDAGVDIQGADVVVGDAEGVTVTSATMTDGQIELALDAEAETIRLVFQVVDVDADDATPTEDLTYPVFVDGEPADREESTPFSVVDPDERDDEVWNGQDTPAPAPQPEPEPDPDPDPGGPVEDDPPSIEAHGFGPVVAALAVVLAAVVGARMRA